MPWEFFSYSHVVRSTRVWSYQQVGSQLIIQSRVVAHGHWIIRSVTVKKEGEVDVLRYRTVHTGLPDRVRRFHYDGLEGAPTPRPVCLASDGDAFHAEWRSLTGWLQCAVWRGSGRGRCRVALRLVKGPVRRLTWVGLDANVVSNVAESIVPRIVRVCLRNR